MTEAAREEEAVRQPARWIVELQPETRVVVAAVTGSGIREPPAVTGAHSETAVAAAHPREPAVLVAPPAWGPAVVAVAVVVVVADKQNLKQGRM